MANLLAPDEIDNTLESITNLIDEKFKDITPEQTAWDLLTRLEENIKLLERSIKDLEQSRLLYKRASLFKSCFEKSRNEVLGNLYDEIRERFEQLYRSLHGEDEKNFTAKLEPDGAALRLEVDFYGRGPNPPHALHSEGHQDSMGLCLYLALAERITSGLLDLIILDDVVMSVDSDHRKQLCNLLTKEFPHKQFLITTHDKNWANQLKADGVVLSRDTIEFYNWCVDVGPQVNNETDLWNQIHEDLEKENIRGASAHLRGGSEAFFSQACDRLRAPVIFKLNGRWELGDLLPAALSQYKYYLKLAKSASNSWNRQDEVEKINELD
ncbi:MAG: chromosome segregation protein SMC, partial [Ignavibacteria bacterium]|nr:chromosome segregation protein SMC [Ignavibacteria bacterium]